MSSPPVSTTTTTTIPCTVKYMSIKLTEGEQLILPPGAVVVGITDPGAVTSLNDCLDLTGVETPVCYEFSFGRDNDNNDEHVMDDGELGNILIDGVAYDISTSIMGSSGTWCPTVATKFATNVPAVIEYLDCELIGCFGSPTKRCEYRIVIRTIPSIAAVTQIYLTGKGFGDGLYVGPVPYTCPAT